MTTEHGLSGPLEALADLPVGWRPVRLRYRLSRNDGGVWGSEDDDSGTIVLRSTEVALDGSWRLDDPARRRLSPAERIAATLHAGDLVVTKSSGSPEHLGKAAVVTDEIAAMHCAFSNFMQRLRPSRDNDSKYVFWFLNSPLGRDQMNYFGSTTTGLRNLGASILGDLILPGASPAQQRSISTFLDRKTAAIDDLIAKKERQIELLQEKRQALITQAVTKGLDPNVPMKDSGVEWLGKVPAHWGVSRIKFAAKLESGHTPDRSVPEYWRESNDIPWVSLNDTKRLAESDYIDDTALHVNELGLQNSSAHLLPAGVVVFTRDATIGKAAVTTRPMAVSQHIIAWVCSTSVIPAFLLRVFYAMEDELGRFTMGATLRTIGMPDVKKLITPMPPLSEQSLIVKHLENVAARSAALVGAVRTQIAALREYRQALISAAVTGKIEIPAEEAA